MPLRAHPTAMQADLMVHFICLKFTSTNNLWAIHTHQCPSLLPVCTQSTQSSCPLRSALTRALLAARVKASNDINVGNKLKMPHCPAMQHLFLKKKIFFPQSNEMCLEILKIKRPFIHSWGPTRGLGRSKGLEEHKVLALFYQSSPDWKPGK